MPFGLCNAPATFQRIMNDLYKDVLYKSVIVFLDDVLTFSRSIEEHMSHLRCTFQRLWEANLKLKPKKCCLLQREVAYLGHIVDKEGSRPNPEKLAALESWPTPTTVTGVRSFIGFCSYYRKYIRGFAEIAKPLHAVTERVSSSRGNPNTPRLSTNCGTSLFEDPSSVFLTSPSLLLLMQKGKL